ncbi:MAG: ABC transporter ATP-binding protein [Myxococcales bacterium]|nr:ABC transporter ATP-binding protein [Myxococcales bacterium]
MIEIRNISKSYTINATTNYVLHNISFRFPDHENIGILGLNGAGKSTLLRIIGQIESPDAGEVRHYGRVSWPIGFRGGFAGSLTAEENCRFVARIYNEDIDRVIDFTRDFAELGRHFFLPVGTYSSGMKARLAFGLSMAINFNVYLIDEVTEVGDNVFKRKSRKVFEERSSRSSLIMVSHNMKTIRTYCSRCAILTKGSLQLFDSVDEAERIYKAL